MSVSPTQPSRQPRTHDEVVLLDDAGHPIGSAARGDVHTGTTPLHLAFSTYLFNQRGQVLVTRRALGKLTWPGVWTNSCCGHPRPGEAVEDAARRRIREELGLHVGPLVPLLPDFRYRAVDASGVVENEVCPVFAGFVADDAPNPDPAEVAEWAWVDWQDLVTAMSATPHVYSPWAALQVPLVEAAFPGAANLERRPVLDVEAALREVDELLAAEVEALDTQWRAHLDGLGLDVLPADLPRWLGDLLVGRGKRLRVVVAYWGFIAAGGVPGSPPYRHLVLAMAALETLHLFALVHDDVMDESESRRGRPAAHVQAEKWHRDASASGAPEVFGRNLAVLLGDLAHTAADRLADNLPASMREVWYELSVELIAGQRADLTGAAAGRRGRDHAERVARLKSGRYTVVRPLELAARAAGATGAVTRALLACGEHVGEAFALRDEYLGVWGDPTVTGKPCSDDLLEAKATVAVAIAEERLRGRPAELLRRLGQPDVTTEDVAELSAAMRAAGVDDELESLVEDAVERAAGCLDTDLLVPDGVAGLREAARALAWRQA